jgi:hypothetical protein
VSVVHNSATTLFNGNVNGYYDASDPINDPSIAWFDITRSVTAGDTIDFSVGYGSNANYYYDSTGLSVTITPT